MKKRLPGVVIVLTCFCWCGLARGASSTAARPDVTKRSADIVAGALMKAAHETNADVRAAAARALGDLQIHSSVPVLISLLDDDRDFVRDAAAEALGRLGDHSAVPALIRQLAEKPPVREEQGTEGLVVGGKETALAELAKRTEQQRQISTLRALAALRNLDAVGPILREGLHSPNVGVQIAAAVALGKIGGAEAADALRKILEDYYRVTPTAPELKDEIKSPGPAGLENLQQKEAYLRNAIVWALGEIGDARALKVLKRAKEDENSIVRDQAGYSIQRIHERSQQ